MRAVVPAPDRSPDSRPALGPGSIQALPGSLHAEAQRVDQLATRLDQASAGLRRALDLVPPAVPGSVVPVALARLRDAADRTASAEVTGLRGLARALADAAAAYARTDAAAARRAGVLR